MFILTKRLEKNIRLDLKTLRQELNNLGSIPNDETIYDYTLNFFNIILNFQDKYKINQENYKNSNILNLFKNTPKDVKKLLLCIKSTGRNSNGIIQAKAGEPATFNNIILENKEKYYPRTIYYWKWYETTKYLEEDKIQIQTETKQLLHNQIKNIIEYPRKTIINSISTILENNPEPKSFININQKSR